MGKMIVTGLMKTLEATRNGGPKSASAKGVTDGVLRGKWPSGLDSLRQVTEVNLGRVRSNSGWVTWEA